IVERQRRLVLGEALAIEELRVFLLQMRRVVQENADEIECRRCAENGPLVTELAQAGQPSGVIHVGMRQEHRGERRGIEARVVPVVVAELLQALEHAAVDEMELAVDFEQVLRARHGPGAAAKCERYQENTSADGGASQKKAREGREGMAAETRTGTLRNARRPGSGR